MPSERCGAAGHLRDLFCRIDEDGNGSICIDELRSVVEGEGEGLLEQAAPAEVDSRPGIGSRVLIPADSTGSFTPFRTL